MSDQLPVDPDEFGVLDKHADKFVEFAVWLTLSPLQRSRAGVPDSKKKWSEQNQIGYRTVNRWDSKLSDSGVLDDLQASEVASRSASDMVLEEPSAESLDSPEMHRHIRDEVLKTRLLSGDLGALKLYYEKYGDWHVEQERAAAEAVGERTDEQLAAEMAAMCPTGVLQAELQRRAEGVEPEGLFTS